MRTVDILDRDEFKQQIKDQLVLGLKNTAVVTVDMHRGHLDPSVATMPTDPEDSRSVIDASVKVLDVARSFGLPVIHVVMTNQRLPNGKTTAYGVPFWGAVEATKESVTPGRKSTAYEHNMEGSPQCEVIAEFLEPHDQIINSKRRLSSFYNTELEVSLRTQGIQNVIFMGINTNTCVLNAVFEAFNRDLTPIVMQDCVASMYGRDLHVFGLENVSRCMGWVLTVQELEEKLTAAREREEEAVSV